uniref:NUDIX domain-containing protein n=1 Tax=Pelagibacter ubique TaxID=198252 RepID=UPI000A7E2674
MKHHKSVHAIILFKGKYFIQKRDNKKNIHFPNFWGLFGGKIKNNELKIDAIIREIKEETNLKINKPKKNLNF